MPPLTSRSGEPIADPLDPHRLAAVPAVDQPVFGDFHVYEREAAIRAGDGWYGPSHDGLHFVLGKFVCCVGNG